MSVRVLRTARPESVLDPLLKFRESLLEEGMQYLNDYEDMIAMIHAVYTRLGLHQKAKPYEEELCTRWKLYDKL